MLCNPHCSHRGHTIVPAWYTVRTWAASLLCGTQTPVGSIGGSKNTDALMLKDARPMAFSRTPGSRPTWSKHICVASLSAAVTVGGKVKAMKCLGSNRAWLKQSPWPGQEANFMQLTREDGVGGGVGGGFMNSEYPTTQLHHTAICPQQPINLWTGQRVISYLTWRLFMCTEVKHFKWRRRESNERLWPFTDLSLGPTLVLKCVNPKMCLSGYTDCTEKKMNCSIFYKFHWLVLVSIMGTVFFSGSRPFWERAIQSSNL